MQEIIDKLLEIMEEFDEDNPATLRKLCELMNLADYKMAKILKKMRVQGLIAFAKEEEIIEEEVESMDKTYTREHPLECFHYWGAE
jgi:Mn-dependent DtxR family transcriptional regulator